jgi:hypothetical protein
MRNRGIRRRRAKRNYVDFADVEELRPAMEHPLRVLHEIRSNARRQSAQSTVSWVPADPSATG